MSPAQPLKNPAFHVTLYHFFLQDFYLVRLLRMGEWKHPLFFLAVNPIFLLFSLFQQILQNPSLALRPFLPVYPKLFPCHTPAKPELLLTLWHMLLLSVFLP